MKKLKSLSTLIKDTKNYVSDNWSMLLKTYIYAVILYFGAGIGLGVLIFLIALASQTLNLELNWITGSLLGVIGTATILFFFALGGRILLLELQAIRQPLEEIRNTFKTISFKDGLQIYFLIIAITLALYSGLLLLVVPGLIISTWLSFALFTWKPGEGIYIAMIRSRAYVLGYFWPILGRLLFAGVIYFLVWYLSMEAYTKLAEVDSLLGAIGYILYMIIFATLTMGMYRFIYELYLNLVQIKGHLKPALTPGRLFRYKLLAYGPMTLFGIIILIIIAMNPFEELRKAGELSLPEMQLEQSSETN